MDRVRKHARRQLVNHARQIDARRGPTTTPVRDGDKLYFRRNSVACSQAIIVISTECLPKSSE